MGVMSSAGAGAHLSGKAASLELCRLCARHGRPACRRDERGPVGDDRGHARSWRRGFARSLRPSHSRSDSSGFPEDSGGPRLAVVRDPEERERDQLALGASLQAVMTPQLSGQVHLGFSRSTLDIQSPKIAPGALDGVPPIASDSRFERFEAVASLDWTPREVLARRIGRIARA